jgi:hypothetical protein
MDSPVIILQTAMFCSLRCFADNGFADNPLLSPSFKLNVIRLCHYKLRDSSKRFRNFFMTLGPVYPSKTSYQPVNTQNHIQIPISVVFILKAIYNFVSPSKQGIYSVRQGTIHGITVASI